jgi:hypothetical protein
MQYDTCVELTLTPVGTPMVRMQVGTQQLETRLGQTATFTFDQSLAAGAVTILVEMFDKSNTDSTTAVVIDSITLNKISDPKFVWSGTYRPTYPEPWASTQINLPETITTTNYLGWNGSWELTITIPVFTWIHQTRGLGWIFN